MSERTESIIRERLRTASGWLREAGYVQADADIGHLLGEVARLTAALEDARAADEHYDRCDVCRSGVGLGCDLHLKMLLAAARSRRAALAGTGEPPAEEQSR